MNEQQEKPSKQFRVPVAVLILAGVVTIAAGFVLANVFKVYRSEMTLMVIAKSEKATATKDDIVENLAGLPKMLSFYELLLTQNPDVKDPYASKDSKHRKTEWDNVVDTQIADDYDGSFIVVSATMPSRAEAEAMSQKTVTTLVSITGKYYDIKNDVDLRIVDGPITGSYIRNWTSLVLLSIACGALVVLIASFVTDFSKSVSEGSRPGQILKKSSFAALNGIKEIFSKKEKVVSEEEGRKEIESIYTAEEGLQAPYEIIEEGETVSEKQETVPENLPVVEESHAEHYTTATPENLPTGIYPDFAEIPTRESRVSNAPANLPVADEDFLQVKPPKFVMPDHETSDEPQESRIHEPSQEELKERLNKLLKGEI